MNLFRAIPLPLYQAPDVQPGASDPPAPDPAIMAATDPATPPPVPEPAPEPAATSGTDPSVAPEGGDPKPHGNTGKKPWFFQRISEESAEKARERDARIAAERERDEARALLDRLQRGGNADPAATQPQPRATEADVETRAQQLADERINRQTISGVVQSGVAAFNDWDQRAEMLAAVGAASPAFVLDVASVDAQNAHKILHQLADDPDKASRLARMDSRARTIELVKMSMALSGGDTKVDPKPAAPPKTVSRAPTPPPPVEPSTKKTVPWWDDSVSDQDFSRNWEESARQRSQRGRR